MKNAPVLIIIFYLALAVCLWPLYLAGSQVVTKLKKGARVFQIGHDQNGFYQVKTSDEPVQFGWVDKSVAVIICPVQCGG